MQTIREGLHPLIDRLSEQEVISLWRMVASMCRPDDLTPEEASLVDQALREIDAGEFADWEDVKRHLGAGCRARCGGTWNRDALTETPKPLVMDL